MIDTNDWQKRSPSQRERMLADLRDPADLREGGWFCGYVWNQRGIFRYGARIWELRHDEGHEIEERICAEHKVAEYRLTYDANWDKEP